MRCSCEAREMISEVVRLTPSLSSLWKFEMYPPLSCKKAWISARVMLFQSCSSSSLIKKFGLKTGSDAAKTEPVELKSERIEYKTNVFFQREGISMTV